MWWCWDVRDEDGRILCTVVTKETRESNFRFKCPELLQKNELQFEFQRCVYQIFTGEKASQNESHNVVEKYVDSRAKKQMHDFVALVHVG